MTPRALDRQSPHPMYHQLKHRLLELIEEDGLAPGDLLPGEHRMCEMYDVSRTVVRQALAQLEHEGVVSRVRGKGTFVAPQKVAEALVHTLHGLHEDMTARGADVTSRVFRQRIESASDEVADALGIAPGEPVVVIERLRFVDGEPWSLSTTWMPEWAGESALAVDLRRRSLYGVLAESGIHAVRGVRSAEATVADPEKAKLLDVAVGGPLLVLRSVGFDEDERAIEFFVAYHRGDRSRFEFQLRAADESVAKLRHTGVEGD
ncbi:GntR family transcriptional regulator [Microbacterium suaedae]|uniref:GntR family transcriptional regulator n=1 Tax=Microbacterium suaedae TaxID=2067813 RepID=UPI001E393622|nr:GntR family transcriptional regulator [Microbacterium suaedae]